ncbi:MULTISPECIES: fimbrial protein [Pseudomonas]|jgi:type 1 fimbria pilin|uniref:Type 1 fimbrial protein n=1 Tax=Pseudomonas asgharzadehiana TaxID=2842349 RepID=A0ABX8NWE9_9PSED|nr:MULTISPECIES: fimbrial protein [Pseudomonas]CRM92500.1 Fimbria A protein precursor [Pseudomonas sp. 22 E 5]MCX9149532.1 type 1 fimbrial protein [Pseudomonas sp. TB1-B1]QXH65860.1 type 1 fimbrial protein [Pseudomonas asgharzadehiana]TKJ65798.1 type 1 fimbrial protein [Pseudomonas sp. CFBP13506]CRM02010.1 Fimbria A protein precursor [Pseudomonas sp. 31 E 6]
MKSNTVKVFAGLLLMLMGRAHAQDVEGMNGLLNVLGSLHESPCSLEMTAVNQTIDLGEVSTSQLQRPGDQANPVAFQLRFDDCQRTAGSLRNERTGNLTWSAYQPVLSVAFIAPADADDPRLVRVQGITGMGLRLTDALGRDVQLGARGEPLFLAVGATTQTWKVQPTRTAAPLTSGAFRAVVDFRLNYE